MFTKLIRIGRDTELRYTPSGKAVCNVVGAYNVGWGDNKKAQWIEVAIWDKQAEALSHLLLKGSSIVVTVDDLEVETFEGNKGTQAKLKGRMVKLEFAGKKPEEAPQQPQQQAPQQQQQPSNNYQRQAQQRQQAQQAPQQQAAGLDEFDDDIPF